MNPWTKNIKPTDMNKKNKIWAYIGSIVVGAGIVYAMFAPETTTLSWVPEGGWGTVETIYTTGKGTDTLKTWTTKQRFEGEQKVNATVSDTVIVDTIK